MGWMVDIVILCCYLISGNIPSFSYTLIVLRFCTSVHIQWIQYRLANKRHHLCHAYQIWQPIKLTLKKPVFYGHGERLWNRKGIIEGFWCSGGSRISRRGGVDLVGGAVDPWGSYISKILHVKMKESGPVGGGALGAPPLDPPMWCGDCSCLQRKYYFY